MQLLTTFMQLPVGDKLVFITCIILKVRFRFHNTFFCFTKLKTTLLLVSEC